MFTGIVEQKGEVLANTAGDLANRIIIKSAFTQLQTGESIAVNGVCLTLLEQGSDLSFDVSPETLKLTNLGQLQVGDQVNLERAMLAQSRFGGHYVSGHVDATAYIHAISPLGEYVELLISGFAKTAYRYLLPKGSITVDGVSLTINSVDKMGIKLMLVPHTLAQTTLGQMKIDQRINVEFDYFTRIVAHQLTLSGQLKGDLNDD